MIAAVLDGALGPAQWALVVATAALAVGAAWTDIHWGKVFNLMTVPFAILGLTLNTVAGGIDGLLLSAGGIAAGFALWLLSRFLGRILGGGDIKLLMAFGALLGPAFMFWTFVFGALIGGVIAVAMALRQGLLQSVLRGMCVSLYARAAMATPMEITASADELRLPYAVALCAGALLTIGIRLWT
ncbi:MAG: A24 family peptidase [Armatimonadota bacterium]|nr:A24 family peptidase [Armatimonadota bacterium]